MRFRACRSVRITYTDGLRRASVVKVLACGHDLVLHQDVPDVGLETYRAAVQAASSGAAYECLDCPDEDPPQLPPAVAAPAGPEAPGAIAKTNKRPL